MGAMSGDEEPWAMGQERALHSRRAGTRAVASRRTPIAKASKRPLPIPPVPPPPTPPCNS